MTAENAEFTGDWDHALLPGNVVVGRDCFIERLASFERFRSTQQPGLVIGDRCRIYTWAAFGIEPAGRMIIGDDSILVGPQFMCAELIEIGRRVIISYGVTIADSDFHPIDPDERRSDAIANAPEGSRAHRPRLRSRPVRIEDDAWIGVGAIVLKGTTIGRTARVGPGAVVTRDVPSGAFVEGNPARLVDEPDRSW
jgi:acetyltransferase-like isoleucine patch superfamily enzyme